MAFKGGTAFVDLTLDDRQFGAGVNKLNAMSKRVSAGFNQVAGAARNIALVGGAAIAATTRLFANQEAAQAKLSAVLKATGNAAGFSADQLFKEARALQQVTTYGDEAVIETQAILATFKNIKGDAFTGATEAALDLATVLGTDTKSAAIQLGKALNDPAVGLTYLNRAGITFSETQRKTIIDLAKSGKMMEAQAMILKEVQSQFGGASRAMRDTFGGAVKATLNALGDVGESIGAIFAPALRALAETLTTVAARLQTWVDNNQELILQVTQWAAAIVTGTYAIAKLGAILAAIAGPLAIFGGWMAKLVTLKLGAYLAASFVKIGLALKGLFVAFMALNPAMILIGGLIALVAVLGAKLAYGALEGDTFMEKMKNLANTIKTKLEPVMEALRMGLTLAIALIKNWEIVLGIAMAKAALHVVTFFEEFKHWIFTGLPTYVGYGLATIQTWAENIGMVFKNLGANIGNAWKAIKAKLTGKDADFTWKGLTEGFREIEMPDIPDREVTDLEKQLRATGEELGKALNSAIKSEFEGVEDKKVKKLEDQLKARKATKAAEAVAKPGAPAPTGLPDTPVSKIAAKAEFGGLADTWERISSSTVGQDNIAKEQLEVQKKQLEEERAFYKETIAYQNDQKKRIIAAAEETIPAKVSGAR